MKKIYYTVKHVRTAIGTVFWEISYNDMQYCKQALNDIVDFYNLVTTEQPFLDKKQPSIRHNRSDADPTGAGVNSIMTYANGMNSNFSRANKTDFTYAEAENLEDISDLLHAKYPSAFEKIRFVQGIPAGNYTFTDLFDV